MRHLTDDEFDQAVAIHERRRKVFVSEGLTEDEAWDLAERMFDRDLDPMDNDIRLCFECINCKEAMCTAIKDKKGNPTQQLRFILQRCGLFEMKGKK